MQNRKDLLQAHRLMTQRVALALICGEPDSPNQPLRRRNTATISAVLAGVIAAAVFGVFGLLSPGAVSNLTQPGTLVTDKDTGVPYVPCFGNELCPAVNFASARLALNTASINRVDVTQSSLANYRIGPTIGITGLPTDLPTPGNLIKGPWSVCAGNGVSTLVGGRAVGGTPLTDNEATLATITPGTGGGAAPGTDAGTDWLLWNGERLKIAQPIMQSLFANPVPTNVPGAWLNAIPQGPDFAAQQIQGGGQPVNGPAGTARVGQVYYAMGGTGQQFYVLQADGKLASATAVQADLLDREPGAAQPTQISPSMAANNLSGQALPRDGLPAVPPHIAGTQSPLLCVAYGSDLSRQLTTGGQVPPGAAQTGGGTGVDQVWLPPGHGALVGVAPSVDQPSAVASWFLVTGTTRYGLASPASSVATALGFDLSNDQTVLPASVAQLLPQGPALDPTAATARVSG
jgi:type VII secretion protein EccB